MGQSGRGFVPQASGAAEALAEGVALGLAVAEATAVLEGAALALGAAEACALAEAWALGAALAEAAAEAEGAEASACAVAEGCCTGGVVSSFLSQAASEPATITVATRAPSERRRRPERGVREERGPNMAKQGRRKYAFRRENFESGS